MNALSRTPPTPLARTLLRTTTVLLLDTSGSMAVGQPRRIELHWRAVQALRTPQSRWRIATFNTHSQWVSTPSVPEPSGTTNLSADTNPARVTLVTDGEPDHMDDAYAAALALGCPIHILFVGDETSAEAVAFCQRVCTATKGTFATDVLTMQSLAQTTATMRKMLGDGAKPSSAIAL
jgi:hypothetical protein